MNTKSISISSSEKLALISNLSTMLAAGISIIEVVDSLLEDAKGNQRKLLEALRADLMQGNHVSTTFEKFPKIFDKVSINLIHAAEEAGTLDTSLKDMKVSIQRDTEFKDKIKGAMTYPIVIFLVFAGVLAMMLIVVVPKISSVFLRLDIELPLPTKILIAMSNAVTQYTIPTLAGFLIFIAIIVLAFKTQKPMVISILTGLPVVSNLVKQIDLVRFSRSMYQLLNAGIPITTCLELTQEVVMRKDIQKAINNCREMILSGKKLSEGMKQSKGTFPSIMVKITEAGEKSGSLEKSMQDISDYLDYQVTNALATVTSLLEPIMLVIVGVLVGGMMLAIISPIYGLVGQIGGS